MNSIRLALAFHNHQPVGNFDGTIEECYQKSYLPFLELIARPEYASLKVSLHNSGCLEEWLDRHHPEYLDRLADLARQGRVEVLGGPFQEPILAMLPSRDRIGQILTHTRWLENRLGVKVRGMWMPERVWEQSCVRDLVQAGMEFTILDDYHFKKAGLPEDRLYGYYLTEDDDRLMAVFPDSEKLRYWIPFDSIERSLDYLRGIAETHENALLFCGDDGEKFGAWPQTFEHVYGENRWLARFFDALVQNSSWLETVTMAEARDQVKPLGKCYLPDCSYREMTEWALSTESRREYESAVSAIPAEAKPDETRDQRALRTLRAFVSGGNWRNFKVKYPETNEMYARMMAVSRRLDALQKRCRREAPDVSAADFFRQFQVLEDARLELYRGQCNCPYWHGAFGGVYLPHLRNGIYRHLISADRLLDRVAPNPELRGDFNLDGELEYRLETPQLSAWIAPAAGGMLYELDARETGLNLLATMARRPEPYHEPMAKAIEAQKRAEAREKAKADAVRQDLAQTRNFAQDQTQRLEDLPESADPAEEDLGNIRDRLIFKQPGLERRLQYDEFPRKSLLDGFFASDVTVEALYDGKAQPDRTFYRQPYQADFRDGRLTLAASGQVRSFEGNLHSVSLCKTVELIGNSLEVTWRLGNLPRRETVLFGVEFNFAGLPGHCPDRYFFDGVGQQLGDLSTLLHTKADLFLGLADEWQRLRVELEVSRITDFWAWPVETVSNSEGGFELVHQSVCVVPHWFIRAENDGVWECRMKVRVLND